ncbi:hypothetical protein ACVWQX_05055 [Neisseria meningitidis]
MFWVVFLLFVCVCCFWAVWVVLFETLFLFGVSFWVAIGVSVVVWGVGGRGVFLSPLEYFFFFFFGGLIWFSCGELAFIFGDLAQIFVFLVFWDSCGEWRGKGEKSEGVEYGE